MASWLVGYSWLANTLAAQCMRPVFKTAPGRGARGDDPTIGTSASNASHLADSVGPIVVPMAAGVPAAPVVRG